MGYLSYLVTQCAMNIVFLYSTVNQLLPKYKSESRRALQDLKLYNYKLFSHFCRYRSKVNLVLPIQSQTSAGSDQSLLW